MNVDALILEASTIYKLSVELTRRVAIPSPAQEVITNTDLQDEIKAKAGIPESSVFVSAVLVMQRYIGTDYYYRLVVTMDPAAPVATGHTHRPGTLFHPLVNAYLDGPSILLDSSLGPVEIHSEEAGTVDYLRIRQDTTDYLLLDSDGILNLSTHSLYKNDTTYDIGSADGGTTLYRPRDVYIGRDSYTARIGYFGTAADSPRYDFDPQVANPDTDVSNRHIYWSTV